MDHKDYEPGMTDSFRVVDKLNNVLHFIEDEIIDIGDDGSFELSSDSYKRYAENESLVFTIVIYEESKSPKYEYFYIYNLSKDDFNTVKNTIDKLYKNRYE